jgi:hypothetical protein
VIIEYNNNDVKLGKELERDWLTYYGTTAGALLEPSSRTNQYGVNFKDDRFVLIL